MVGTEVDRSGPSWWRIKYEAGRGSGWSSRCAAPLDVMMADLAGP